MSGNDLESTVKRSPTHAVRKVRSAMNQEPLTIAMLMQRFPELTAPQISMSLAHLMKKREVQRQQVPRTASSGRAQIWAYTIKS